MNRILTPILLAAALTIPSLPCAEPAPPVSGVAVPVAWTDAADRFYRGYFLAQPGARYVMRFHSDDGCELYANGRFVTRQGGLCHQGGTVKGSLELSPWMTPGVNLVAAHLSNAPVPGGSLMSVVLLEVVPGAGGGCRGPREGTLHRRLTSNTAEPSGVAGAVRGPRNKRPVHP